MAGSGQAQGRPLHDWVTSLVLDLDLTEPRPPLNRSLSLATPAVLHRPRNFALALLDVVTEDSEGRAADDALEDAREVTPEFTSWLT